MGEVSIIEAMVIDMNESQVRTLEQVRQVVGATQVLEFRRAQATPVGAAQPPSIVQPGRAGPQSAWTSANDTEKQLP